LCSPLQDEHMNILKHKIKKASSDDAIHVPKLYLVPQHLGTKGPTTFILQCCRIRIHLIRV
jgi:hypothetical protein